jgi:predicted AAA+ superfamily ATPase
VGRGGLYNLSSRRKRKLYFFDTGIRNAILKNFDPIDLRPDKGALWENLCVNEIEQKYSRRFGIFSYWRGDYGEVDLLVRTNGTDYAYEFKYGNNRTFRTPKHFKEAYKGVEVKIVSPENLKSTLNNIST